ncbi:MAG: hypothetical protein K8T10_03680 [Candidatus Eremiobacteraeota bacterium]|nr:hypothetical protein [Candidatus Eremiobacteraeota bacterium]
MDEEFVAKLEAGVPDDFLTSLYEQVLQLQGEKTKEKIEIILATALSSRDRKIITLIDTKENNCKGFAIFDGNFIRFFYLSPSIPAKKYASFVLTEAVVKEMREQGAQYIISYFPRLEKYFEEEDLSPSLQLMDFSGFMRIDSRSNTGRLLHISRNHEQIYEQISFYSYVPEEHKESVLQLMVETGDNLIDSLFHFKKTAGIVEDLFRKTVFLDESGSDVEFSSDCSTVAFDNSGKLAGFLLCRSDGVICDFRLPNIKGIKPGDVLYLMVERAAQKLNYDGKKWLAISYYDKNRQKIKTINRMGFREINEYMVWGWSELK